MNRSQMLALIVVGVAGAAVADAACSLSAQPARTAGSAPKPAANPARAVVPTAPTASAVPTTPPIAANPAPLTPAIAEPGAPITSGRARIEIMFVLDTTGSMSGLIEGAKKKIWSIASTVATAKQRPQVLMGLVGYRDRGDAYITTVTPLTEDLDSVYSKLMQFSADGGGDEPESVNQALAEALDKAGWTASSGNSRGPKPLQIIYLVGDAPPHMDYADDVKYPVTCKAAATRGIFINAIQCGSIPQTTPVWKAIASASEGEFFQIDQGGGVTSIAAPQDAALGALEIDLEATLIDYGNQAIQAEQISKRTAQSSVSASSAPAAAADRATYNMSDAGSTNLYGRQELVRDVRDKRVKLADIPVAELPKSMQSMTVAQREQFVHDKDVKREEVRAKIAALAKERDGFLRKEMAKLESKDSFDAAVTTSLRKQAERRQIEIPGSN